MKVSTTTSSSSSRVFFLLFVLFLQVVSSSSQTEEEEEVKITTEDEKRSSLSRKMASIGSVPSSPSKPTVSRASYPEKDPHICLAFLSCCDRIDLLNHTLAGAIRHMEEDEPSFLRYEIAWVDNGSDKSDTAEILNKYQIERPLRLPSNSGLAYGMNLLVNNLCTAPYILLLEEDWLYLDEVVAPQSPERKRAVATSIALIENLQRNNITAYDRRSVMGVFLRQETYDSFLTFPYADNWERRQNVDIKQELKSLTAELPENCDGVDDNDDIHHVHIDYRIYCSDPSLQKSHIWGSYTNGAGLYKREDLIEIGRMYGEPNDPFHNRYTESNFAYRAGLKKCHSALRLTDDVTCDDIHDTSCAGAFHHIGGGRGTVPMNAKGSTCEDPTWNFLGTPMYHKYRRYHELTTGTPMKVCSREELKELQDAKFHDTGSEEYRKRVMESNRKIFEEEQKQREEMRKQGNAVLKVLETGRVHVLESMVPWLAGKSQDEIRLLANRLIRLADSPHPLAGFWDSHGRIIEND